MNCGCVAIINESFDDVSVEIHLDAKKEKRNSRQNKMTKMRFVNGINGNGGANKISPTYTNTPTTRRMHLYINMLREGESTVTMCRNPFKNKNSVR